MPNFGFFSRDIQKAIQSTLRFSLLAVLIKVTVPLLMAFPMEAVKIEPVNASTVLPVVSGQSVTLSFMLTGTLVDGKMNAELFQGSDALVMPLNKGIPIASNLHLQATSGTASCINWKFNVPDFPKTTNLLVVLHVSDQGVGKAKILRRFKVFPASFVEQSLKAVAKEHPIRLVGESIQGISGLLKKFSIPYEDRGRDLPENADTGTLYLGEVPADKIEEWSRRNPQWQGRMLLFDPNDVSLSETVITDRPGTRIIKVRGRGFQSIETDPVQQLQLITLMNQLNPS